MEKSEMCGFDFWSYIAGVIVGGVVWGLTVYFTMKDRYQYETLTQQAKSTNTNKKASK